MNYTIMDTLWGEMLLAGERRGLERVIPLSDDPDGRILPDGWKRDAAVFQAARKQIEAYLAGNLKCFDLRLAEASTAFGQRVRDALLDIPYGETRTYRQVAEAMGNPSASRAVGRAIGRNPLPIVIPCHRVIGADGKMRGYRYGLAMKQRLLDLERLNRLYEQLLNFYGPQKWWPAETETEMVVGAVLTQNTAWTQVEEALHHLVGHLTPQGIRALDQEELIDLIRPAGFQRQKAERLVALMEWLKRYGDDWSVIRDQAEQKIREELLGIKGIGQETADCIMTYAVGVPFFVVDTSTRRLLSRLGFDLPRDNEAVRRRIERAFAPDLERYREFHALIIIHGKRHCKKTALCLGCPIRGCSRFRAG